VTAASVNSTLSGLKDFQSFLGPKITCNGSAWPNSSSCTSGLLYLQVQPDGSIKPTPGDGFFTVSSAMLPK
jgi:branched-chain amino acid transport system substrate-binding protein